MTTYSSNHPNTKALTSILSLAGQPSFVLGSLKAVCGVLAFVPSLSKHCKNNLSSFNACRFAYSIGISVFDAYYSLIGNTSAVCDCEGERDYGAIERAPDVDYADSVFEKSRGFVRQVDVRCSFAGGSLQEVLRRSSMALSCLVVGRRRLMSMKQDLLTSYISRQRHVFPRLFPHAGTMRLEMSKAKRRGNIQSEAHSENAYLNMGNCVLADQQIKEPHELVSKKLKELPLISPNAPNKCNEFILLLLVVRPQCSRDIVALIFSSFWYDLLRGRVQ
ncbi:hypothetical protein KCU85_g294, partial [Aureobasidium melanogenum]